MGIIRMPKTKEKEREYFQFVNFLLDLDIEMKSQNSDTFQEVLDMNIKSFFNYDEEIDRKATGPYYRNNFKAWPCEMEMVLDILKESLLYTVLDNELHKN
jgi:hypothetical protein